MAYTPIGFVTGQFVSAGDMNHIEAGLSQHDTDIAAVDAIADAAQADADAAQLTADYASIIGEIKMWCTGVAPTKYLLCDGSAVSRTTYAGLFAVIGTTFGAGDGSTTFNLPNMKGKVVSGYDSSQTEFNALGKTGGEKTHILTVAELAEHDHQSTTDVNAQALSNTTVDSNAFAATGTTNYRRNALMYTFKTGKTGSNTAHNNIQPYITLNFIIRAL